MARKTNSKKLKNAVAIVGEGITEWHYFSDLKQTERYSFKVKPELPKHSDVDAIVKKALDLLEQGYDKVLCIFDLDRISTDTKENTKYQKHKKRLHNKSKKGRGKTFFFETMPCIEFWFLLHFVEYSTRIYPNYESLKPKLLSFLDGYDKSEKYFTRNKIYKNLTTRGNLELAIKNAQQLILEKENSDNILFPFTEIHNLLKELEN